MTVEKKKFLKKVLKGIIIVIIVFITISMVATKFVYDYVFRRFDAVNTVTSGVNGDFSKAEKYSYPCGNHNLTGFLYKAENGCGDVVIMAPGFRAESLQYAKVAEKFAAEGFDVFIFDSTGHGESEGNSSLGFPQIINDLNATISFVEKAPEFSYDDIFLVGHSRGGYGVCCVLNEHKSISAAVSVNGVNTAMEGIMAYSVDVAGKIAYVNFPFLQLYQTSLFGSIAEKNATDEVNSCDVPVMIIQSENDENIPKDEYSIYAHREQINSEGAKFILYNKPGNDGHTSILYDKYGMPNEDIIEEMSSFFKENTREESARK